MDEIEWWEFDSPRELAEQAAGDIGFVVESAIGAHGGARLAVPGGKTPEIIYQALLSQPIDWAKVTLIPTDERLVPRSDPLSNGARLERLFAAKGAQVVPLVEDGGLGDYREAGRAANQRLSALDWPLDLAWLGMDERGGTASILPGPDLDTALSGPRERRAIGLRPEPMPSDAAVERVTLTAAALSSARAMMIVILGEEKKALLEQAIKEGPLSASPIGRLIAESDTAIDILWSPEG